MEAYPSDAEICEFGFKTLMGFLMLDNQEHREQLGREGLIELITETMKKHIESANACKYGCSALFNITDDNNENAAIAGQAGAIEVIVSAVKKHIENVDVCIYGCFALYSIAFNGKARQSLLRIMFIIA